MRGNAVKNTNKRWLTVLKKQAKEFCLGTGLHGYKYIVQSERTKIERIIWAIIVMTSLACAGALMQKAWHYNSARPTVTVIESTHHGIWNYPFPAVTICNINRVSLSNAKMFARQLQLPENITEEFLVAEMGLLNELLYPGIYGDDVTENLTQLQDVFDSNGYTISEVVEQVSQNCSNLILGCKWKGNWTLCSDLFSRSLSRDGLCCSFNYITTDDPRKPPKKAPSRVTSCGYQTGLTVFINAKPPDYLAAMLGSYGVKVMLHYPYDYPDNNAENKLVGIGNQVFLSVSPEEMYSTSEVRSLAVKTRQCVFSDEKTLPNDYDIRNLNLTYTEYTYKNCMAACRARTIKEKCKCIPYYFPQRGTRVCDLKDVKCLKDHRSWFETSWPGIHLTSEEIPSTELDIDDRPCGCLPDCTLYRFPVESSVGVMDLTGTYTSIPQLKNHVVANGSMVHIFFSDLVSIQYRKHANYNWRNMFASFGGLLGLFAGFSLMSGYELVYFFVIRVIADTRTRKKAERAEKAADLTYESKVAKRRGF